MLQNTLLIKNKTLYCEHAIGLTTNMKLKLLYRKDLYLCRTTLVIHLRELLYSNEAGNI